MKQTTVELKESIKDYWYSVGRYIFALYGFLHFIFGILGRLTPFLILVFFIISFAVITLLYIKFSKRIDYINDGDQ